MSETDIIQGCVRNDRKYQEILYKQYYSVMMHACMKYTRDEDKALQILNDGFLKVFKKIGDFRSEGSFEGWIRRIIYTTMADYFKKENSYIRFIQFDLPEDRIQPEQISGKLEFEDIMNLLDHIPEKSADVFRLYAIDGFTHEEIGKQLNISTGTSKWHLSHAREKLKTLLIQSNHVRSTVS